LKFTGQGFPGELKVADYPVLWSTCHTP